MRKRTSKRRWKARCLLGQQIPREAIVEHELTRWFMFSAPDWHSEFYVATGQAPTSAGFSRG